MDKAINSATDLQTRIRRLGLVVDQAATETGVNGIDISGSLVAAATSFTVS